MSTFVQAMDGKFYKDPIVYGPDWWLNFSDGDPEAIVRRAKGCEPSKSKKYLASLMEMAGVSFEKLRYRERSQRRFPVKWEDFLDSYTYDLTLTGPIPVPGEGWFATVVEEPGSVWDCCLYGFYSDVPTEDCAKVILGGEINQMIARALLSRSLYDLKNESKVRPELCKKIYIHAPWLRGLVKGRAVEEQLAEKPKVVRLTWTR